jgi:hypothetical protein
MLVKQTYLVEYIKLSAIEDMLKAGALTCPAPQCGEKDSLHIMGSYQRLFCEVFEQGHAVIDMVPTIKKHIESITCHKCQKVYVVMLDAIQEALEERAYLKLEIEKLMGKVPTDKGYLRVM